MPSLGGSTTDATNDAISPPTSTVTDVALAPDVTLVDDVVPPDFGLFDLDVVETVCGWLTMRERVSRGLEVENIYMFIIFEYLYIRDQIEEYFDLNKKARIKSILPERMREKVREGERERGIE